MPPLPLEPTDDRADPVFRDVASCNRWLSQLQLTNLQLAHSQLLAQLNEFNRYPVRAQQRFDTLEALRDTIHHVQNGYARRFIGKPLPLNENELVALFALAQLWHELSLGYQRCLQDCMAGDRQPDGKNALLCQRTLMYIGLTIHEHLAVGYEFDPGLWHRLHGIYSHAEEQGLLSLEIDDPQTHTRSTCLRIYLTILLSCHGCPARLNRTQLHLLSGWLPQWTTALAIERRYSASREDAQPLAFDLSSDQGLQPVATVGHGASMRYIAMVPLSKLIRVKTIMLQQDHTPKQVDLGEQASASECIELLTLLHRCWCEQPSGKHPGDQQEFFQLCYAFDQTHDLLSGKPVRSSGSGTPDKPGTDATQGIESWRVDDDSMLAAELTREAASGIRMGNSRLVALRRNETAPYVLGKTARVKVTRDGMLHLYLRFFPGTASAIALLTEDTEGGSGSRFSNGFLLHPDNATHIPASLIVPPSWFRPGLEVSIQVQKGERQLVRLGFSVERGHDFERVSFTPV